MKDLDDTQTEDMFGEDLPVMPESYDEELLYALHELGGGSLAYAITEYRRLTTLEKEIDYVR